MLKSLNRFRGAAADYTIGTAIVMMFFVTAQRTARQLEQNVRNDDLRPR